MLGKISRRCLTTVRRDCGNWGAKRSYAERRRRKGDGTKTDIFEERSAASQEEYFRKETARQLKKLREDQKLREKDTDKELSSKDEEDEGKDSDRKKK